MNSVTKIVAAAVLAALVPLGAPAGAEDEVPMLVAVDEVRQEVLGSTATVIGRIVARESGVVAARARGPVAEVRVEVGDRVEEDEVLAVLVDDRLKADRDLAAAELAESQAELTTAEAALALARQELARLEALRESAAFSQARFDDKRQEVAKFKSEVAEAKASLERARANLRIAEIDLYNARVRAPYAGVVSLRHTVAGAYLDVGAPVATLINDRDLEIEADVPAARLGGLAPGTPVTVNLGEGVEVWAAVRAIVPDENPRSRTRAVRFTIESDPPPTGLAMNQTVLLDLPIAEARRVTSVHKDAVIVRQGQHRVFVVEDGGRVRSRAVELGEAVGNRFEVLDGVKPGDLVVVRGNERLQNGQKVRFDGSS